MHDDHPRESKLGAEGLWGWLLQPHLWDNLSVRNNTI